MTLQDLIKELINTDADSDLLLHVKHFGDVVLGENEQTVNDIFESNSNTTDIVDTCVTVWNTIITHKSLSSSSTGAIGRYFVIKILAGRQNSKNVDRMPCLTSSQIQEMGLLTCRCLLECGQFDEAEDCLKIVSGLMEKQKSEISDSKQDLTTVRNFHRNTFILNVYWAEVDVKKSRSDEAFSKIQQATDFVVDSCHNSYLVKLCYNFGLEAFRNGCFEESVNWLKLSFDSGKNVEKNLDVPNTLSLLAEVYLKWDAMLHWEKAKQALELMEKYGSNNALLLLRCMLSGNVQIGVLEECVQNCITQEDASDHDRYKVLHELLEHGRTMVAATMMPLFERMGDSSSRGQFLLFSTKTLLLKEKTDDAKLLLQHFCTVNKEIELDETFVKSLCVLTMQKGMEFQSLKKYDVALDWYMFSSHFVDCSLDSKTSAVIARNKCFCSLQERNILTASKELQKLKDSGFMTEPIDCYMQFKVFVLGGDFSNALKAFQELGSCETVELLCIATQDIIATGDTKSILTVLEKLYSITDPLIKLTSCKLLLHIYLTTSDIVSEELVCTLTTYLNVAYESLCRCTKETSVDNNVIVDEAKWFAKVAWNLSLLNSERVHETHCLFALCSRFLALCLDDDSSAIVFRQMVLMMVAASGLTLARTSEKAASHNLYETVLEAVEDCESMVRQQLMRDSSSQLSKTISSGSFSKLLLLYKFEACARLNNTNLEKVFEELMILPQADSNFFERMAAVSKSCGSKYYDISIRSMKMAISRHLDTDHPDNIKLGQLFRSLVKLALEKLDDMGEGSDEDCLEVIKDTSDLIYKSNVACPGMEMMWLTSKTWNIGIQFLITNKSDKAERWLHFASQLARSLPKYATNYREKMTKVLSEICSS